MQATYVGHVCRPLMHARHRGVCVNSGLRAEAEVVGMHAWRARSEAWKLGM